MDISNMNRIRNAFAKSYDSSAALLITSHENRLFSTGFSSTAGVHILSSNCSVFITDFRYIEAARKSIKDTEIIMIKRGEKYSDIINFFCDKYSINTLLYEDRYMTAFEAAQYKESLKTKLIPQGKFLNYLRASKNEIELEYMRTAQKITDKAFLDVLKSIKKGMTEREIQSELIYSLYKCGGDSLSFEPIVVSGPNSSLPHGKSTERVVNDGEFITMDFGVLYKGYCSDMTRTVCVGKPSDKMVEIYNIVLEAQALGLKTAKAGLHSKLEYDQTVRDFITSKGYGDNFGHGLGHGVGIEIHEDTDFDETKPGILPENCVISCEPGIYLEGEFGVRIEDCVILQKDGCEDITFSPKELIIL